MINNLQAPSQKFNRGLKLVLIMVAFFATIFNSKAQFLNLPVTGYNADVVGDGAGIGTTSTTHDVDGAGWIFVNTTFSPAGTVCATGTTAMPASNTINSLTNPGLSYTIQPYNANNSLRLASGTSGLLSLVTPTKAANVYLLALGGSGACTITATITFDDATTQVATGSAADWCSATGAATTIFYRISRTATTCTGGTCQYLFDVNLPINSANYNKNIVSISVASTGGILNVMGVGMKSVCTSPLDQPTSFLTPLSAPTTGSITGVFDNAATIPTGYLVVRYPTGAIPTSPVNGTTYLAGGALGLGTIVQASSSTSINATGLSASTAYDFYIYSYNSGTTCGGPIYNTVSPLTGSATTAACGAPTIGSLSAGITTITVGATGADVTTIADALNNINTFGINTPTLIELQSNYVNELTSNTLNIISNSCYSATNTLTIRPALGATGLVISSSVAGPTINMNGASFVTIDGRPGGIGGAISIPNSAYLSIRNTLSATTAIAIQMINDASNNTVKYCDLQGQGTTSGALPGTPGGVVFIGNTTGGTGNDNNTIDNCNIHSTSTANTLTMGVYSYGPSGSATLIPTFNDNNNITNNNIYDIYGGNNLASAGIELDKGTNGWTISGNSFFQTINRTPVLTAASPSRFIYIAPTNSSGVGNGFTITGNYMGGMAPQCGGNNYSRVSTGSFNNLQEGIHLSVSGGVASNIKSNTINNINIAQAASTADLFHGIWIPNNGNVNIGGPNAIDGNTIGTSTDIAGTTTGITLNSTSASPCHMIIVPGGTNATTILVQNNKVGGITLNGNGMSNSGLFCNSSANITFDNNLVGSTTVPNSINATSTGTTSIVMRGINIASGSSIVTITNNTIANLRNASTSTTSGSQVAGIVINSTTVSVPAITGNTVRNLSSSSTHTGGGVSATVLGIASTGTVVVGNVSNNTVDSLVSTSSSTTSAMLIYGMFVNFNSALGVSNYANNSVSNIFFTAANTAATIRGIETDAGTVNIINNVVRLGFKSDGSSITSPISITGILKFISGFPGNIYHNSVYIGGTGVTSGALNSVAFSRYAIPSTGLDDISNNIFVNTRSGAGAGRHYAIHLNQNSTALATTANTILNNNVYQATGTNGYFAGNGTTVANNVATYTPGWFAATDLNSWNLDPQFIAPTAATPDLHISTSNITPVESTGISIPSVTLDKDGNTRSSLTPTDIGAYAGNYLALLPCVAPNTPTGVITLSTISVSQIDGLFNPSVPAAESYLVVRYLGGATPTLPIDGTTYNIGNAIGSGIVIAKGPSTSFSATGLFSNTTYDFYVYPFNATCIGTAPTYNTSLPMASATTNNCAGLTGTIPVGPTAPASPLGFSFLKDALAYLNTNGMGGNVILELQSDYSSVGDTVIIGSIPCLGPLQQLTIRPAIGATNLLIASSTLSTIDINGGSYVTIDGRPGGIGATSELTIQNSLGTLPALRLINEASNNTIKYCKLESNNNSATATATAGVVLFGNTTGANGNDNNLIDYCDIGNLSGGNPVAAIHSLGSTGTVAQNNENNTISNSNIRDFFSATIATAGIYVGVGNGNWTITNNHLYQTATRTYTGAVTHRALWITPNTGSLTSASGFNISDNYIGGNAANGSGLYTMNGTVAYVFMGMDISVGVGAATNLQGNTITNMDITMANGSSGACLGISIANGNVNCGTTTGNLIGSTTTNGAITFTTTTTLGGIIGIRFSAGSTCNISNNIISGINLIGNATTVANSFNGINYSGGTSCIINNNTVGSATLANSINLMSTSATSTSASACRGIVCNTSAANATVTNNLVANINTNYSAAGTQAATLIGIAANTGTNIVSGNTIYNLTSNSQTSGTGAGCAIMGIYYSSTTAPATVTNNTIHTLKLTNPTTVAATQVEGITYAGPTTGTANIIEKNFVHSLSIASTTNSIAVITGLELLTGIATVSNNMIRVGIDDNGNDITAPCIIRGITESSATSSIFHNTVYVGGNVIGTVASNTFAYQRTATTNADDVRNNIFVNNRSNSTTGGKHYQVFLTTSSLNLTLDYNNYYGNGAGSVFGNIGASDLIAFYPTWVSTDINSIVGDPNFVDPIGSAVTVDLHITNGIPTPIEQTGAPISSVVNDFDGQVRASFSPNDMGADADNFVALNPCAGTPPTSTATLTNPSILCVSGSKTLILTNFISQPGLTYQWQESATGVSGSFVDVTSGTGGNTISYNTPVLTASNYYQCIVKCTLSGDSTISSPVFAQVNPIPTISVTPITGTNVCSGSNVDLTATGASTYVWTCNPGLTGYPQVSLFSTPNNLSTVTSRPTSTLATNTAAPPATAATGTWTYTVVGTDAAGCTSSASVALTVTTAAVVPLQLTYSYAPDPTCAPGTPITFTVNNNGTIGSGQWTYDWYDNTGAYLFQSTTNALATDTYTPATPTANGRQTFTVKVSNSVCPSSYAIASPSYFVGYTSLIVPTDANCGDNGSISIYPEGQTDFSTWYTNSFATGLLGPAFDASYGNTNFTGGLCNITPQANGQNGTFLVRNPASINTNDLQVDFKMSTGPRGFAFNILGADGMAWSYGPDVFQGLLTTASAGFNAESGSGTGFKLAFDATANGAGNTPGAYLMYNCTTPDQGPTSPGVIAFKQGSFWQGLVNAPVSILISENGFVTVSVNNQVIFDHVPLPNAYLTANKSNWIHGFTARTGGSNQLHAIDDLNIRYNNYEYSINSTTGTDGTWQASNLFSALAPGTYPAWVRKVSDPLCFSNTGSVTIGIAPSPASAAVIPSEGFSNVVCYGNSTTLKTDIFVPGAIFLWESSNSATGPWNPATGINSNATYTTDALTTNTYFRMTFECPSSVPVESSPLLVTVNAGTIASTNSPQTINCIGSSATLNATPGANTTCVWYDVPTGGSPMSLGNSYVVTPTSLPATYYVEPVTTVYSNKYFNGGQTVIANTFGTASSGLNISTRFSTTASIILDSIKVIPSTSGTLVVALQNAGSGTNISSFSFTITSAMVGNFTNIPINLTVPGSGNYQITTSGVACSYYSSYTGSYTVGYMSLGGVFSLTGASTSPTGTASTAIYGSAFRIAISSSCPAGSGARIPVIVQANPAFAVNIATSASAICQGSIASMTASSANAYSNYSWTPVTDLYSDAAATIPYLAGENFATVYVKPSSSGNKTYTVSTDGSGCLNTASTIILVNALPNIIASASPSSACTGGNVQLTSSVAENNYLISSIPFAPQPTPLNPSTVAGDEGTEAVNIGFTFGYFGNSFTDVTIHANGYIQLGSSTPICTSCYSPQTAPNTATPNNWVGIWADMNVTAGQITYETSGTSPNRKFVVNYNNVNFFSATPSSTHQIILNEIDNSVEIHLTSNVTTATNLRALGIENSTGTIAYIPTDRNSGTWSATNESWKFTPTLGSYTYDWSSNPTYLSATNISNPVAQSMVASQTYTVQVTDATTSCSNTKSVIVNVNAPTSSTTSQTVPCAGSFVWNGNTYTASGIYTFTTTGSNGCDSVASLDLTVSPCNTTLNLTAFIEGYWDGTSAMLPVLLNQGQPNTATECDSIIVELISTATAAGGAPYTPDYTTTAMLNTNGTASAVFTSAVSGNYYIVIKHRNALQTWSANAMSFPTTTSYDFSSAASQAYGSNQSEIATGVWALFSGDLVVDENMDLLDLGLVEADISNFLFGYLPTDINGDGNVDLLDSPVLETNISNFVFSAHP